MLLEQSALTEQAAAQTVPLQLPLEHWLLALQVAPLASGRLQAWLLLQK
jgi:hypothetical protein